MVYGLEKFYNENVKKDSQRIYVRFSPFTAPSP